MVGQVVLVNNVLERSSFLHQERAFADEIFSLANKSWMESDPEAGRTAPKGPPVTGIHIYRKVSKISIAAIAPTFGMRWL